MRELLIAVLLGLGAVVLVQVATLVHPVVFVIILLPVVVWANPLFSVIGYRLTETSLEVTFCRVIRWARVPYAEIREVRRIRWSELLKPELRWAESLGSNIFRPLVLVLRRKGRRRAAIVTPEDTDAFVAKLRARVVPDGDAVDTGGSG